MHSRIISILPLILSGLAAAFSSYTVTNNCQDTKYLTLSNDALGVLQLNAELPGGTSRNYFIDSQHALAVANSTAYWDASTYKLVLGTNTAGGILYYAIGTANGYPLINHSFAFTSQQCPSIYLADGSTKGCADNNVVFSFGLCV